MKADVELALYLISLATVDEEKLVQKEWLNCAPGSFMAAWCNLFPTSIFPVGSSSIDVFQL